MSSSNFHEVKSDNDFKTLIEADLQKVSLLSFWKTWARPCEIMNIMVKKHAETYKDIQVLSIEPDLETLDDVAETFCVQVVPTIVLLRGHTLLTRIEGANEEALKAALDKHTRKESEVLTKTDEPPQAPPQEIIVKHHHTTQSVKKETEEELIARIKELMVQTEVVLFMKGTPESPRCGFSRKTADILTAEGVKFTYFDILTDDAVRQGMKKLNDWPTFPQIIIDGDLFGDLGVLKQSIADAEFYSIKGALKKESRIPVPKPS